MEYRFIFMIIFLNSLFFSFSIVQEWNFENSSKDLLSTSDSNSIEVLNKKTKLIYMLNCINILQKKMVQLFIENI